MAAATVVSALLPGPLNVRGTFGGGTSIARGCPSEMFLAAELVFATLMLANEEHRGEFLVPVDIASKLFLVELNGVYYTGSSTNPARSCGPCVVVHGR